MDYKEAIDYLYNQLPSFEKGGAGQYKPGLETALRLSELYGNPHNKLACVHIAGTNGKGTTAHTLAAIMQSAGYKTGLYTSPHLTDFRERIRVDGEMIPHEKVTDFVQRWRRTPDAGIRPTFFELTTIMAFEHFVDEGVDIAIIETGLGGRLDTTNIVTPEVAVITNISLDHTDLLGDTVELVAAEKAGIFKPGRPAVVGEESGAREVFETRAREIGGSLVFAPKVESRRETDGSWVFNDSIHGSLKGEWQPSNAATILATVDALRDCGWKIPQSAVERGFEEVESLTGLRGRWTVIGSNPLTVYDTGHNPGAWVEIARQLAKCPGQKYIVTGFVADKDVDSILELMPKDARYFFTQPHSHRALPAEELMEKGKRHGLKGESVADVNTALEIARSSASRYDTIFIGGSNYLIAELSL